MTIVVSENVRHSYQTARSGEYFDLWRYDATLDRIHETLCQALREAEGRDASPTAGTIDSRTVNSAETYGPPSCKRR